MADACIVARRGCHSETIQLCMANVREYRRINERSIRRDIEVLLELEVAVMRDKKVVPNIGLVDGHASLSSS